MTINVLERVGLSPKKALGATLLTAMLYHKEITISMRKMIRAKAAADSFKSYQRQLYERCLSQEGHQNELYQSICALMALGARYKSIDDVNAIIDNIWKHLKNEQQEQQDKSLWLAKTGLHFLEQGSNEPAFDDAQTSFYLSETKTRFRNLQENHYIKRNSVAQAVSIAQGSNEDFSGVIALIETIQALPTTPDAGDNEEKANTHPLEPIILQLDNLYALINTKCSVTLKHDPDGDSGDHLKTSYFYILFQAHIHQAWGHSGKHERFHIEQFQANLDALKDIFSPSLPNKRKVAEKWLLLYACLYLLNRFFGNRIDVFKYV